MDLSVEVRAHDRWPRVPKHGHLKPIVGDIAVRLMHASPQIFLVFYRCTIRKLAGGFSNVPTIYYQVHPALMRVGTISIHWEHMLLEFGEGDRHSERQNKDVNTDARKLQTLSREREKR